MRCQRRAKHSWWSTARRARKRSRASVAWPRRRAPRAFELPRPRRPRAPRPRRASACCASAARSSIASWRRRASTTRGTAPASSPCDSRRRPATRHAPTSWRPPKRAARSLTASSKWGCRSRCPSSSRRTWRGPTRRSLICSRASRRCRQCPSRSSARRLAPSPTATSARRPATARALWGSTCTRWARRWTATPTSWASSSSARASYIASSTRLASTSRACCQVGRASQRLERPKLRLSSRSRASAARPPRPSWDAA
mmetsp:Transcript_1208/g.4769  ORF Transcript_1208/g.4769 Transcript_1208/m.4769 type:complete len:257 (+) Transcript_1208:1599-2369(+)